MTDRNTINAPEVLIIAVQKVLRPLVRLLLNFRVVFPQLAEILKGVYVEIADEEFSLPNKKQTDTRISLLTGIHRKDIKRLRNSDGEKRRKTPENIDVSTRIIARWISEETYLDNKQKPLALPFQSDNDKPSFEMLVHDVCKQDIRPRVVLDEWINLGVVTSNEEQLELNVNAFITTKGLEEKAFFLGHNVSDHLAAATHNLLNKEPPFFERCIYYDSLTKESIQQLESLAETKGMETLLAINELAMKLRVKDAASPKNNMRIDVGLYTYHENEKSNETHSESNHENNTEKNTDE